ncbi:MAG: hypothetical protein FWC73_01865 [Defluviitaleaceae bacterium]|nr:hypothetical protein [Defluviitaleaceae bacterium]
MRNKGLKKPQWLRILTLFGVLAICAVITVLGLEGYEEYGYYDDAKPSDYIYQLDEGYIGYTPNGYEYEGYCNYMMPPPPTNSDGGGYGYQFDYLGSYSYVEGEYEAHHFYNYAGHDYLYGYPVGNIDYLEDGYDYGGYIGYAPDYYYSWHDETIPGHGLEYYYVKSCDCHGYVRQYVSPHGPHDWFAGVGNAYVQAYGGYIGIAPLSTPTLPITPPIPTTIVDTPNIVTNIAELQAEINWVPNNSASTRAYRIRIRFPGNVLNNTFGASTISVTGTNRHIILDAYDEVTNQTWNRNVAVNERHITINGAGVTVELRNVTLSRTTNLNNIGGGVHITNGRFIMNHPDAAIRNSRAPQGGGIYVPPIGLSGSIVWIQIKDGIIENNHATSSGGGVFTDGHTRDVRIIITGGRIRDNHAVGNGGGLGYCCRTITWVADSAQIYNNVSSDGGGIHNGTMGNNHLFMLGGEIRNNIAITNGGGIHRGTGALTFVGGNISYNRAVSTTASNGNGGGIFIGTGAAAQVTFYGGSITNNHASGNGGGIHLVGGFNDTIRFNITYPLTISGNRARWNGGGIHMAGTSPIDNTTNTHFPVCNLVTIVNNTAGLDGGGILVQGSRHVILYGGTISNNGGAQPVYVATAPHSVLAPNITQTNINTQRGGGAHVAFGGTLRVSYGLITNNFALGTGTTSGYGGGISVDVGRLLFEGQSTGSEAYIRDNEARIGGGVYFRATNNLTAGTLTASNTSPVYIVYNEAIYGGGVGITLGGIGTGSINEHITIRENTAEHSGGGIFMRGVTTAAASEFNVNGSKILDNDALGIGVGADAGGGGIFVGHNTTLNLHPGSLIAYNTAYVGGGVRVFGRGGPGGGGGTTTRTEFIMHEGTIRENTALAENLTHGGGGVEVHTSGGTLGANETGALFTMHNGEIVNNISYRSGGGVNINSQAQFLMHNGNINGNRARQGGGIFVASLPWTTISPPATRLPAVINGGEISYNKATTTTTAQYVAREVDPATGAVTPGVYNGSGGGIYVIRDGHITIANANITNNHAYEMGGGIFTEWYQYDVATLTEADVYTNLTIANSVTFDHNTAGQGDFTPPTNAYDWTGIPGLAQSGSQSIHDHPINNYDINFRREAVTTIPFTFHKTTAMVYTAPNLVNIADITPFLLEGAYFSLFRFEGSGTPPTTVIYPSADWERVYYDVRSTGLLADPITMELTPDGIYHLVEVLAPSGFQTPFGQWRITHDDNAPGEFVIITVGGSAPSFEYLDGYFYVGNIPDFELPLTGRTGHNQMLWAGSLALLTGFGIWAYHNFFASKKGEKHNNQTI